ncbi:MAG TPA: hypothetical protein PLE80_10130, partial [Opitutaceae bacterium]|nr:hypothetical protein [Opitutaceae bacterium]
YVPVQAYFDLLKQQVSWTHEGRAISLKLRADHTYMLPNGYKIRIQKPRGKLGWRLTGTSGESTLCHKPCTVSGGGKSEISKSISDAILGGPVFVADIKADFDAVEALLARDYSQRFREPEKRGSDTRPILSARRSLGSVIKLLSPSPDFTDEYNAWLAAIPPHIKELVFVLKRLYKAEWGNEWRKHFQVDVIDGSPANELRLKTRKLEAHFLRVGFSPNGSWRTFSLRKDFNPAQKIQWEDDITASVVVPRERLTGLAASTRQPSLKIVQNCEYRLFQRPDDAIHRGYDHQTESDFARNGSFFSNYAPSRRPRPARWSRRPSASTSLPRPCRASSATPPSCPTTRSSSARPTRASSMASPRKTRATSRSAPICSSRWSVSSPSAACTSPAACRSASPCPRPSMPCSPAAAIIPPTCPPASAPSPSTARSTTWSSPSCSWSSSAP